MSKFPSPWDMVQGPIAVIREDGVAITPHPGATGARRATVRLGPNDVRARIGFEPNIDGEPHEGACWGFTVDEMVCSVWYNHPQAAFPGANSPRVALEAVFGKENVEWHG